MALEALKKGHVKALGVVGELRAVMDRLGRGEVAAAVAALQGMMGFLEEEQKLHFRQEEEGLFLYMARITGQGPLQAMVGEHESYWKAMAALKGLLDRPRDGTELERVVEHLVTLLEGHIHREETAFFAVAEERLSPNKLREVDEEMEAIASISNDG